MDSKNVKIVVFVPESHAEIVREAIGKSGAGKIGNYDYCSFTTKGVGRFRPTEGANPHIGEVGNFEEVAEERIEVMCEKDKLQEVVTAIEAVHPYDEVALDVYALESI